MPTTTQQPAYTKEMAEAAAETLPPALTSEHVRERRAVLNPASLIPVDADLDKVRAVQYEYVVFVLRHFAPPGRSITVARWIVEAHPEWGPMGR